MTSRPVTTRSSRRSPNQQRSRQVPGRSEGAATHRPAIETSTSPHAYPDWLGTGSGRRWSEGRSAQRESVRCTAPPPPEQAPREQQERLQSVRTRCARVVLSVLNDPHLLQPDGLAGVGLHCDRVLLLVDREFRRDGHLAIVLAAPLWEMELDERERVVFQKWRWPCLHRPSKSITVDKQANDNVVHLYRFRKANGLAHQAFHACP
jgi:hypothetical protein